MRESEGGWSGRQTKTFYGKDRTGSGPQENKVKERVKGKPLIHGHTQVALVLADVRCQRLARPER